MVNYVALCFCLIKIDTLIGCDFAFYTLKLMTLGEHTFMSKASQSGLVFYRNTATDCLH